MTIVLFLLLVTAAGLGGYGLLIRLGLDDFEAWAGGRLAGLVAVAFPIWWAGVLGLKRWQGLGLLLLLIAATYGGYVLFKRRPFRALLAAEAVFLVGVLLIVVLRLDHASISGTEKPMDMGIFASLMRAEGFPPPDMWLAGEGLAYYYWGALIWTVPLVVASIPLEIAYNLIVALIGGLVGVLLWSLGRRLGGGHWSGLMVMFFGALAGTPDGLRQLLAGTRLSGLDYWHSSRQIQDTITEFPLFTLWLGDLHPHLLSMPLICMALLVALEAGRRGPNVLQVAALTVLFGAAYAANPWCMPPTLVAISLLLMAGPDRWYWPTGEGQRRWVAAAVIAVGGWLLFSPFHLNYQPVFGGVKRVMAWTAPQDLLLYGGVLLIPAAMAAIGLVRRQLGSTEEVSRAVLLMMGAAVLVLASVTGRPTLLILLIVFLVFVGAVLSELSSKDRPAFALAALGVFLFFVPEMIYVADDYGEALHRMNTIFKSFIQGWIFLAVALPVLLRWGVRHRAARAVLVSLMVVVALPHPMSMVGHQLKAQSRGLDGLTWMRAGDRAIVRWLRQQPAGTTIIEAVGGAYSEYSRFSAASGVPTLVGWSNHEMVWRGSDILVETGRREEIVKEIYSVGDPAKVRDLVTKEGFQLVVIGSLERKDFEEAGIQAVIDAGEIVLDEDGGLVVRIQPSPDAQPVGEEP